MLNSGSVATSCCSFVVRVGGTFSITRIEVVVAVGSIGSTTFTRNLDGYERGSWREEKNDSMSTCFNFASSGDARNPIKMGLFFIHFTKMYATMTNKIIASSTGTPETVASAPPADDITLTLHIYDPLIQQYLSAFAEDSRAEKALEALKVGIIALQSASPTLDTQVVEEKFHLVQERITTLVEDVRSEIHQQLARHFASDGSVAATLNSTFGTNGQLHNVLSAYFNDDGGKLSRLIEQQVGVNSRFAKALNPDDANSVIAQLKRTIQTDMLQKIQDNLSIQLAKQFLELNGTIQNALGSRSGQAEEAKKGTAKGKKFEDALFERVASIASGLHDIAEHVGGKPGKGVPGKPQAKTGDYVLVLGESSGAPEQRIVVEVKNEQRYTLNDALTELKEAKLNREAHAGIFIFEKETAPAELGEFFIAGGDFVVTVSHEALENNEPEALLYVRAAYLMSRRMLAQSGRVQAAHHIDGEALKRELAIVEKLNDQIADIRTKTKTIHNSADAIDRIVTTIESTLQESIKTMLNMIGRQEQEK
jgi:hypothetical protein